MKEFKLSTIDGLLLTVNLWDDVQKPTGVIQLVHGSAEHTRRYEEFAQTMNQAGFIVIGADQRGHGKTANDNTQPLGYFGAVNGWKNLIDDQLIINSYIKKNWIDLPVFMLGHSMGSVVALNFAIEYSKQIDGLILSGIPDENYAELLFGYSLSWLSEIFTGPKRKAKLIWNMSYKPLNKKWAGLPTTNGSEWQSQIPRVQKEFQQDPTCGQPFTTAGFKDMFYGMMFIKLKRHLKLIDKSLPILIASGKDDPVGKFGKAPTAVYEKLKALGYNVELKLYDEQRHEILFEPKKQEVMKDMISFMNKTI